MKTTMLNIIISPQFSKKEDSDRDNQKTMSLREMFDVEAEAVIVEISNVLERLMEEPNEDWTTQQGERNLLKVELALQQYCEGRLASKSRFLMTCYHQTPEHGAA